MSLWREIKYIKQLVSSASCGSGYSCNIWKNRKPRLLPFFSYYRGRNTHEHDIEVNFLQKDTKL